MKRKTQEFIVGYRRKHHAHSLQAQSAELVEAGASRIYDDMELLLRQRRKNHGDVVAVRRVLLLADPTQTYRPGGVRQSMLDVFDRIEASGAIVLETSTGLRSDDKKQRDRMQRIAIDELSRARKGSKGIGRPINQPLRDKADVMSLHWRDHKTYETNEAAVDGINLDPRMGGMKVTESQVLKVLKGSGRRFGRKPTKS